MQDFEVGSKVKFKAGGPTMVVAELYDSRASTSLGEGDVLCKWWEEKEGDFKLRVFYKEELELVKDL